MRLNAYDLLCDVSRPSAMLATCTPATPEDCLRPAEFAFIGVIKDFHVTWKNRDTRFYTDYASACRALKRSLTHLDEILPSTCLVDAGSDRRYRKLQVMNRTWDAIVPPTRPYTIHHVWYDLHTLRADLSRAREPALQRVVLASLPVDVQASIAKLLEPEQARAMAVTNKLYKALCAETLNKHGKVSLWYNNAYMGRKALLAASQQISAPASLLGRGLACLWAWFCDRSCADRAQKTTSMVINNRWSWARTVSAEFKWLAMPDELRAWTTCFGCGILSLEFLCDLRLDAVALTVGCLNAISQHNTLAGLELRACGIMPHTTSLPELPRLRRLALVWDPASAFETGAAAELVPLAKYVVHLRLESRVRGGPIPLAFHPTWQPPKLRKLQRLVLIGVAAKFAQALLSACRTRSLEAFVVHFRFPPWLRTLRCILLYAAACSCALEELVIDGLARPDGRLLREIVKHFPVVRSLAILPRQHNQVDVTAFCWNSTIWSVAAALQPLVHLERLCINHPVCADAVGPMHLDRAVGAGDGAEVAAARTLADDDDNVDEGEAAVKSVEFHFPAMREVAFASRGEAYMARVQPQVGGLGQRKSTRLAPGGFDRPWWMV